MTRNEYDDIESAAAIALMGLLSHGAVPKESLPAAAFDIAEAFQKEKMKRIGERPGYDN